MTDSIGFTHGAGARARWVLRIVATTALCGGLAVALGACSAGDDDSSNPEGQLPSSGGASKGAPGAGGTNASLGPSGTGGTTAVEATPGAAGSATQAPPPPPEKELESAFEAPVATDRYI